MKTISSFIFLSILFTGVNTSAQQISKAALQVNGLTCSMCSKATETSLKSLDFIESITADLNANVFLISFKAGRQVDLDQLRDKVQDAGFSVGDLTATINFEQTVVDENGFAASNGTAFQFVNAKNQTLNGPVTAHVVDKDFIPSSAFKKNVALFNSPAYLTGKGTFKGRETRIFHLSI